MMPVGTGHLIISLLMRKTHGRKVDHNRNPLTRMRLQTGERVERLALDAQVSPVTWRYMETGKISDPHISTVSRIARVLAERLGKSQAEVIAELVEGS